MARADRESSQEPAAVARRSAAQRARRVVTALACALWTLFAPHHALAAAARVAVHVIGVEADRKLALEVLHERLDPLELAVSYDVGDQLETDAVLTPGLVHPDDLARIWLDLTPADRSVLYVTDGPWERILVRRFERHENFEVTVEEMGHAVSSAVLALRAGERIGVAREELAPKPAPVPLPPPRMRPVPAPTHRVESPWHLHGGALFEVTAYGNGPELATGPGGALQLEHVRGARVLGAQLSGQFRLPSSVTRGPATIDLDGGTFRLSALAGARVATQWQVTGVAGFGLDVLDANTRGGADVRTTSVHTVTPLARFGVMGLWHSRWVRVVTTLGLDVQLNATRYLLERTSGDKAVLFSPWRAQPFFAVGLQTP